MSPHHTISQASKEEKEGVKKEQRHVVGTGWKQSGEGMLGPAPAADVLCELQLGLVVKCDAPLQPQQPNRVSSSKGKPCKKKGGHRASDG